MSDNNLTPEESERVAQIRLALEQELRDSSDKPGTAKAALNDLEDLKGDFLAVFKQAVKFSPNEALKVRLAMWGYDKLIAEGKANADPLAEILAGMERVKVDESST